MAELERLVERPSLTVRERAALKLAMTILGGEPAVSHEELGELPWKIERIEGRLRLTF